jgi:predicted RNase H-like nuclease (RuvC/YqgF family)
MAARKRLADLLQEEAEKFTPSEGETAIEVTAEEITEEKASPTEESAQQLESTAARRSNPTKADLEATLKELTTNLEKSQQKQAAQEQKIVDLQATLSEQKASIERLTKELNETKQTALHLAEENSKLIEENNALKQSAKTNSQPVEKAPIKETSAIRPVKESYNPLTYRKSHRSSEKLAERQTETNDDFAQNTWLYD